VKDFTTLDCAIMTRIAEGACTFASINAAVEHLAEPHAGEPANTFRVVDRRLQALRKRGLIYFGKTKWFMATTSTTGA
jgi:hypothetical protein